MAKLFRRGLFIFAHQIGDYRFYSSYKKFEKNQWRTNSELRAGQDVQLRRMINYVYNNVPYYHKVFKGLDIMPGEIKNVSDLERLPILTKDIIKRNWEDFKPKNLKSMKYYEISTGGSTGTPFRYRLSKYDRFLSGAMLYRGWGYAGYQLGDKMIFLAGSSLDIGSKSIIIKRAHEISRNIRKLSSFDMSICDLQKYTQIFNSFKPKYLRGYASSINFFANYIKENNIKIEPISGVFTTAEKLLPNMRENIENTFGCDIYDGYGLNDGGVGAYECSEHSGLHIDMERSIMEIVDKKGHQMEDGVGSILATSLYNYAMPFIRYETGDLGHIIPTNCGCGRGSRLLKEIVGRSVDVLVTPEGKSIHGWFFLYIFWEYGKGIKEYQVVQEKLDKVVIEIVPEDKFDERQLDEIMKAIRKRSLSWNIEFKLVDKIKRTSGGKYKFIVNGLDL